MAPFVEFDLSAMIHSTTESVRLYGTPVLTGGKLLNMLTVRSGLLAVSCCGLVVPRARNTHYDHMKSHIKAYDNAEELLEMFDKVVEMSKSSKSPYKYVCDWFKAQFPKYAEIPNLDRKELIVKPLHLEDNENIA